MIASPYLTVVEKHKHSIWSTFLVCLTLLAGSHYLEAEEQERAKPSEILRTTYELANQHHYTDAEALLSRKAIAEIHGMMARLAGGNIKIWDGWTKNGTITRIEILQEEIHQNKATVRYRLHYKDLSVKEDEDDFVIEDGQWKFLP